MEQSLRRILTSASTGTTTTTAMPTRVSNQPATIPIPTSWTYTESHTTQPQPETKTREATFMSGSSWHTPTTTRVDRTRQWVEESNKRTARASIDDVRHLWTQQASNDTGEVLTTSTSSDRPAGINNRTGGISGMEHFQKVDSNSMRTVSVPLAVGNVKLGEAPIGLQVGHQQGKVVAMAAGGLRYSQSLYRHLLQSGAIRTSTSTSATHGIPLTVSSLNGQQLPQYPGQSMSPTLQTHQPTTSNYQPTTSQIHRPTTSNYQPTPSPYQPTTLPHQPSTSPHQPSTSAHPRSTSNLQHTTSQGSTLVSSAVSSALRTMHGDVTNALIPGTPDMDVSSSESGDDLLTEHFPSSSSPHSEQLMVDAPSVHTENESDGKERLRKQILKRNPHVKSTKAKSQTDKLTPEEERRRGVRRQRNKEAAQRCRSRRTALAERLFKEYQDLECKNTSLKYEVRQLEKEQAQLDTILQHHAMKCSKLKVKDDNPRTQAS